MFDTGVANTFALAGANGELLLMLLIAFTLGALFGRILLSGARRSGQMALPLTLPTPSQSVAPATSPDDLRQIPGIGPKAAAALNARGIHSFAQLAQTKPERLHSIMHESGVSATGTRTWPMMAAFLAARKIGE